MVIERCHRVKSGQREESVREISVDIFSGMKHGTIRSNMKIDLEKAEVEAPTVPDECHDSE